MSSDRRAAAWLFACAALFYLPFAHGHFSGSDEFAVFVTTQALFERGDLTTGGAGLAHDFVGRDGRRYSVFGVGQSLLALPFYAVGSALRAIVPEEALGHAIGRKPHLFIGSIESPEIFVASLYPAIASGVLVALFFLLSRELGASRRSALLASALLAATTCVAAQSVYFLRHTTVAVLVLGALLAFAIHRRAGGSTTLAVGSLLACSIVLVRVPAAIMGLGLAGYLAFVVIEHARRGSGFSWASAALALGLPAASVAAVHLAVNQAKWGSWIASPMLEQSAGFTTPLHVGLAGLLFSPGASLFVYSPLLLLLPFTLPGFFRERRAECVAVLAISLSVLLLVAGFEFWHGLWSAPGARMVFVLAPLLMLPLGPWLDRPRRPTLTAAVAALAAAGFVVQLGLMSVRWSSVMVGMGYRKLEPAFAFLWDPGLSPALASLRTALDGFVDIWLWSLFTGVPGREANPVLGAIVLALWAAAFVFALSRLRSAAEAS